MSERNKLPAGADMKKALGTLRKELDLAFGAVLDNNPWLSSLVLGNGTYDSSTGEFSFRLKGTFEGSVDRLARDYEDLRAALSTPTGKPGDPWYRPGTPLPPLHEAMTFNGGERYEIVGARPRAKFNVVVRILSGLRAGKKVCYKAEDISRVWVKQQGTPAKAAV